jgi:hypothetical protein
MFDRCLREGCERSQRARQLCDMHYTQLKRAGLSPLKKKQPKRASGRQLDAQLGQNSNCVDCGERPLFGGMRCLPCFQVRCAERSDREARVA